MRSVSILAHTAMVVTMAVPAVGQGAAPNPPPAESAPSEAPAYEVLLDQYCVSCHNEGMSGQGTVPFAFEALDVTDVGADAAMWETVARKLRLGMMPPLGRPRPDRRHSERQHACERHHRDQKVRTVLPPAPDRDGEEGGKSFFLLFSFPPPLSLLISAYVYPPFSRPSVRILTD